MQGGEEMLNRLRQRPLLLYLSVHLALLAAAAAFLLLDRRDFFDPWLICPFHLVGLYCPTCGMTRALHRFLSLDPLGALRLNPCLPAVLAVLIYYEVAALRAVRAGSLAPLRRAHPWPLLLLLCLLLLWGALLNVLHLGWGIDLLGDFS